MDRESAALSGLGAVWCQGDQFPEMPTDLGPGSVEVSSCGEGSRERRVEAPAGQGIKMGELRALRGTMGPGPEGEGGVAGTIL